MMEFIDIHAHFVYGVDGGAQTRAEMEAMLDAAYVEGIVSLFATPHITPGVYRFDDERYLRHLNEARVYCSRKGYGMQLHAGAENMYTPAIERYALERKLRTLGDSNDVLMEFAADVSFSELEAAADLMDRSGYGLIIAHVERYDCLYRAANAYRLKHRYDIRYQMNCSSVIDRCGFFKKRCINKWLRSGLIDYVASDAHDCSRRPFRMREAYNNLKMRFDETYAKSLTMMNS